MSSEAFFEAPEEQSIIKTTLVSKYFWAWAKVMLSTKSYDPRIAYVDLFSGPGEYADGTPSTPMELLGQVIKEPSFRDYLVTIFNDKNPDHAQRLDELIGDFPLIETLSYRPEVLNLEVGADIFDHLKAVANIPSLYFIDPFGYRGLSLDLIGKAIRSWGCDCIFFFNYNRINPGIDNAAVDHLMRDLFGDERLANLRTTLSTVTTPSVRQSLIIDAFTEGLKEAGGEYVLPFEFRSADGDRTSHYIFFVTKHFRGYSIMKDIMCNLSNDPREVRRFQFVPSLSPQLSFFADIFDPEDPYSIPVLKEVLCRECSGRRLTVADVYQCYSINTPYTEKNFKKALIELEAEGQITVDIPASDRRKWKGEVTLADARVVTFS